MVHGRWLFQHQNENRTTAVFGLRSMQQCNPSSAHLYQAPSIYSYSPKTSAWFYQALHGHTKHHRNCGGEKGSCLVSCVRSFFLEWESADKSFAPWSEFHQLDIAELSLLCRFCRECQLHCSGIAFKTMLALPHAGAKHAHLLQLRKTDPSYF